MKHFGELPHELKKKCVDACASVINSTSREFQPDLCAEASINVYLKWLDDEARAQYAKIDADYHRKMMLMNHPHAKQLRHLAKDMDERCMPREGRRALVDSLFIELVGNTHYMGFELVVEL